MTKKLEDQEMLNETNNNVLMGTSDVNQQSIEEILDRVICKVVTDKQRGASQVLKTEAEQRSQGNKKEVLTSFHRGQVLLQSYQISHSCQIYEIFGNLNISRISHS